MDQNAYADTLDQIDSQKPTEPVVPGAPPPPTTLQQPAPNPYLDTLTAQEQTGETAMRKSLIDSASMTPEKAADSRRISLKLGVPVGIVQRNYDDYKKREALDQPYAQIQQQTPHLAGWLQDDPTHAAIAKDDLEHLGTLEWLLTAPQRAYQQGAEQITYGNLRTASILRDLTPAEHDQLEASKELMTSGGALGAENSWFRKTVTGAASFLPTLAAMAKYGVAGALEMGAMGAAGGSVLPGVGTLGGGVAGAGYGASAGMLYGGAKIGFNLAAGQAYDEYLGLKDELGRPIDPTVAKVAALATGAVNAGLMTFGLEKLAESIPGVQGLTSSLTRSAVATALKSPTVRTALLDAVKSYGGTVTATTATMIAQRAVTILGGELAKGYENQGQQPGQGFAYRGPSDIFGDLVHEGVNAATSFALVSAAGPLMGLAGATQAAAHAKANETYFRALGGELAASETLKRSPDAVQELLARATKDGPIPTVYAPLDTWATYWQEQGVDPAKMAEQVTGDPQAFARAQRDGTDLAIPTSKYATTIAPTEHNQFFASELRMHPDEMNTREAEALVQQQQQEAKRAREAAAPVTERDIIRRQLAEQLTGVGYDEGSAGDLAHLVESAVGTVAEASGVSPYDLYPKLGIEVQRPELEAPAEATPAAPGEPQPVQGELPTEPAAAAPAAPVEAPAQPSAVFLAYGPDGPLYNIVGGPKDRSTVSAAGLEDAGIPVPETPADTGERLNGAQMRARILATVAAQREAALANATDNPGAAVQAMRAENPNLDREVAAFRAAAPSTETRRENELRMRAQEAVPEPEDPQHAADLAAAMAVDLPSGRAENDARAAEPGPGGSTDQSGGAADGGVPASTPRVRERTDKRGRTRVIQETPDERAARLADHQTAVFAHTLSAAKSLDAGIDPADLRQEFDYRVNAYESREEAYRESGRDPLDLLRAIAKNGGLGPESEGGLTGELRDLASGQKFGAVHGIQKVFRGKRVLDDRGQPLTGLGFDVMLQRLQQDPQFAWIENTNMLIDAIDDAVRNPPTEDAAPGTDELRKAVGIDPKKRWWLDSWRPQAEEPGELAGGEEGDTSFDPSTFGQDLFDLFNAAPPTRPEEPATAVDTLDTGEQQPRLPVAGDVREQNVQTPEFEAPFALTSETVKPKGKQSTLFQPFYHGSPHDFEGFSLQHIGSGEGAQAYGWGLYFAEHQAVAEGYKQALSDYVVRLGDGQRLGGGASAEFKTPADVTLDDRALAWVQGAAQSGAMYPFARAADQARNAGRTLNRVEDYNHIADRIEEWERSGAKIEKGGHLYTVDIPDEHVAKMLDWDKPLSEQSPAIQHAVIEAFGDVRPVALRDGTYAVTRVGRDGTGTILPDISADTPEAAVEKFRQSILAERGQEIYRDLALANSRDVTIRSSVGDYTAPKANDEAASRALNYAGVPGIRYFDQVSRGKGDGTRNAVVFNTDIVKLTHKDGSPATPEERQEFFQGSSPEKRGAITFGPDGRVLVKLFAKADLSTFLHETGHFFLEMMGNAAEHIAALDPATLTDSQRQVMHDYGALLEHLGVEKREQIGREQHETMARSFEAYLMEGKAPSLELRSAFARFRGWLLGVYRTLTNLHVQLTPEVRGVFDRMLASDQAIKDAEASGRMEPMFTTPESAGMSPTQFALYRDAVQQASDRARSELDVKLQAEVRRQQTAAWKAQRADIRDQVTGELSQKREYLAIAAITKGELPDGRPMVEGLETPPLKLSRADVLERYGPDRARALERRKALADTGGLDPDYVAQLYGFSSGDELLTAVTSTPAMKEAIDQETDRRQLAQHGSMLLDGTITEKAQAAAANPERDAVVRAELRALWDLQKTVKPFEEAATKNAATQAAYERRWLEAEAKLRIAFAEGRKQVEIDKLEDEIHELKAQARGGAATIRRALPSAATIQAAAESRIGETRVRDLTPATFWSAARKAATKAVDQAARQDFSGAIESKTAELLHLALYREAEKAQEDIRLRVNAARDLAKPTTRATLGFAGDTYLDQVDGILDRYEFARVSKTALDRRADIRRFVSALEAQGLPVDLPPEVLDDARRINYQEISYNELRGVTDGLKQILHIARMKERLLDAADKRDFQATAKGISDRINELEARKGQLEILPRDKAARAVGEWFASHTKLANFVARLDGFQEGGPMFEAFMRPINEASTKQAAMSEEAARTLHKMRADAYTGSELAHMHDKLFIPAIGDSLSKEARLAVALNWGNEGNRQRLMESMRHWNGNQVQAILDTLDERDLKFVQDSIDYVNSFRGAIAAKQKRITGLEPEWVEAASWTHAKYGEQRGGYYPIAYDGRLSVRQGNIIDADVVNLQKHANYAYATTKRGYLEARQASVNAPVRLELGVMYEHVEGVIHDLTHHEMLIDVGRLMADRSIQKAIQSRAGDIVYKQMRNALLDIALGTRHATTALDRAINYFRSGVTIAGVAWNATTALHHLSGVFNGMERVGIVPVLRGMQRMLGDATTMENSARFVADKSEMMRLRYATMDRDLNDLRGDITKQGGWFDDLLKSVSGNRLEREDITRSYTAWIQSSIKLASLPVWLGGYEKHMAEPMEGRSLEAHESRAIALADQYVLDSMGGGQIKDLAQVQRGSATAKLFTTFYTYGNLKFNQTERAFRQTNFRSVGSVGQMLTNLSLIYLAPAVWAVGIARLSSKHDDQDSWIHEIGRESLAQVMDTMVLLRELHGAAQMGYDAATGRPVKDPGYEGPTGLRLIASIEHLTQQIGQGQLDRGLARAAEDVGGVIFHLPLTQLQRSIDGWAALSSGASHNPMVMLTGAPKQQR